MTREAENIQSNISAVKEQIAQTAERCARRPSDVRLVAVGKTQNARRIGNAINAGAGIVGENYIQEAREKFDALSHLDTEWHFIGHLQSNKAKYAVRMFDLIHSVDSFKLAKELDKQAKKIGKIQPVLVQVNNSGEKSKSGVQADQAVALVKELLSLENLQVRGLMTMPPFFDAPEKARPYFASLRGLRDQMEEQLNITLGDLSMGMTGDFQVAIEEGATLVRIGTALFGIRQ